MKCINSGKFVFCVQLSSRFLFRIVGMGSQFTAISFSSYWLSHNDHNNWVCFIKWLECPESGQDVEINITNIVRSGNPTADQWLIVNQSSINTGVCCPFFVISWHHHFLEALKNLNCIFCYLHPFWQSISILGNSNFLCPWFPASVSHELILFYVAHYHNKFRSHCNT